jgi:uncharacterized membrane protein YdbT with pleckstrin-like domain
MKYVDRMLATDERVVRISHDHWIVLLPAILVDVIISLAIVGLSIAAIALGPTVLPILALVLLFIPLAHLAWRIWVWQSKRYIITSRRIIQISGMVNKRVSDTLLEKINDIVTEQSALGRLLGYGDVEIIAGSESGIDVFYRLADPVGFKRDILDQQPAGSAPAEDDDREDADSVPELIAELDELRKKGLLTDSEFEEKKRKLLDRI